jgi:hypothetical protein
MLLVILRVIRHCVTTLLYGSVIHADLHYEMNKNNLFVFESDI